MNEEQIEDALQQELVVGDVKPVCLAHLMFALNDGVKWLRGTKAWGLKSAPLDELAGVQTRLVQTLEKEHVPLPVDEVVARFKTTRFYRNRQEVLEEGFITACLRVHPDILVDQDNLCGLKRWERHRTDEIILALREIGDSEHYMVIAEKTNVLLDPEMRTSTHNIHALMSRRTDLFVRVGRGFFGLKEWGLPDDGNLANAAYRVLTKADRPLRIEAITDRVLETWRVGRPSVQAAVHNDDRFYRAAPATFGLLEWEIERLDETQPVLNICPPPLPGHRGERNTFFESVLVARNLLRERPTAAVFLRSMLRWVGTDLDKSERYLQNVLNAYYVAGLLPYTVYRQAADTPLHSTLPETDDLQTLRRFCFDCMMERLARMSEFVALLAVRQPCSATDLTGEFHTDIYALRTARDEVLNRLRILKSLGVVISVARARYRLTPLGEAEVTQAKHVPSVPQPASMRDETRSDASSDADIGWLDAVL